MLPNVFRRVAPPSAAPVTDLAAYAAARRPTTIAANVRAETRQHTAAPRAHARPMGRTTLLTLLRSDSFVPTHRETR